MISRGIVTGKHYRHNHPLTWAITDDPTDAAKGITRSPVWRIIVVEEWPIARDVENADNIDASGKMDKYVINPGNYAPNHGDIKPPARVPAAYRQVAKRYSDWFRNWKCNSPRPLTLLASHREFDQAIRTSIRISTVTFFLKKWKGPKAADATTRNKFQLQYPYVERPEFYFTTDKSLDLGAARGPGLFLEQIQAANSPNRAIDVPLAGAPDGRCSKPCSDATVRSL